MQRCTAPIYGHRTASGRANCPVCGNKNYSFRNIGYNTYKNSSYSTSRSMVNDPLKNKKAPWASSNSLVRYTASQIRTLQPVRKSIECSVSTKEKRDIFLCHAWDDRKTVAKELCDALEKKGVSVWFSEKDVPLGSMLLREIDKGLSNSRAGIILVTPAFIQRIHNEGVAEKELSALLVRDLLIPVLHRTTYEELREESPLLASRSGLSTNEDSMESIAEKIAELFENL